MAHPAPYLRRMARSKDKAGQENLYRRGAIWWVRFTHEGREYRRSTGKDSLHDARAVRSLVIESVKPRPVGEAHSFEEMVDQYFEREARSIKPGTAKRYLLSARALSATFGNRDLRDISRKDVSDYIALRRAGGIADATIRRDLAALSVMLNAAVGWEWLDSNPIRRVRLRLKESARTRFLTPAEWKKLSAAMDPDLKAIATLAVETGLRLGEILNLEWRDIDRQRREIRVREGKTGGRVVPASQTAVDVLRAVSRPARAGLVFSRLGTDGPVPLVVSRVSQRFAAAAANAGIADVRFHDLRHTFASWKVQQGHDLYAIQRTLGHKGPQMTQRYAHLRTEDLHRLVGTDTSQRATHLSRKRPGNKGQVRRREKV